MFESFKQTISEKCAQNNIPVIWVEPGEYKFWYNGGTYKDVAWLHSRLIELQLDPTVILMVVPCEDDSPFLYYTAKDDTYSPGGISSAIIN